ncbi:MAG: UvrD-helicase domain-containing protein [Treponema sp.]|nr:UvrD-helicase domain-containing protein [Treponema sp.]
MAEEKVELDADQAQAVKINKNSVVSAGAGSGKTRVLAKRFSDILRRDQSCRVDQILTLTFTKKATVEMNERIYKELAETCPEKAKDFFKANIKTLDSYCSQIAKTGCHYFGISPDFSVDQNLLEDYVRSMAIPFILKNRNNKGIMALGLNKTYEEIAKDFFGKIISYSTVVEPIDWNEVIEKQKNIVEKEFKKLTDKMISLKEAIREAVFEYPKELDYITDFKKYLVNEVPELAPINFDEAESENRKKFLEYFRALVSVKKSTSKNTEHIKEMHRDLESLIVQYASIENFIYGLQYVKELIPLAEEFYEQVCAFKRRMGVFAHSDISSLALRILREYPEIRQLEKEKYKYIMIDEFQDNNEIQKNLLFMLSEKNDVKGRVLAKDESLKPQDLEKEKLFFVGDEKQSIYKFRGADVTVFRSLSEDFKEGNLELRKNYRSHPALIAMFNSIFGGMEYPPSENKEPVSGSVFYTESDLKTDPPEVFVPDYEAVYHNVEMSEKTAKEVADNPEKYYEPHMTLALVNSKKKTDEDDDEEYEDASLSEANWVVKKIIELTTTGINGKVYKPEDIAILFRKTAKQTDYENLLLKNEIPYTSENISTFYSDGPVNDISSILRTVIFPTDVYAFSEVLRSSFVNLSFSDVKKLLLKFDTRKNLFEQDADEILKGKALERYKAGQELYKKILLLTQDRTNAEIVSYLWYETGYRFETLLNKKTYMYSYIYDVLFELARRADADNKGLADFLKNLETYKTKSLSEMEIPFDDASGVKLLTIHKSKGLEFPVVFVTGCGAGTKKENNTELIYNSSEYGPCINTPFSPAVSSLKLTKKKGSFFFSIQEELSNRMNSAENRRVIYVAVTRAQDYAFLTGAIDFEKILPSGDFEKPVCDSFLGILMPSISSFVDPGFKFKDGMEKKCPFKIEEIEYVVRSDDFITQADKKELIEKISEGFEKAEKVAKEIPPEQYVSPSHLYEKDEEFAFSREDFKIDESIPYYNIDKLVYDSLDKKDGSPEFNYANFGTIAHAYMEAAVKNEKPKMLNREVVGLCGSEKKIKEVHDACVKMYEGFKESLTGKKVSDAVNNKKFVRSEYSFKSMISGKIINGQIDLVFQNENDGFTIVDYKTNREVKPEIYYIQLACYRQAVAKMMGVDEEKITCVLYYLRYDKEVDVTAECSKINIEECVNKL